MEPVDWSSTIDPSYVIHLIRQLLPLPNERLCNVSPATLVSHYEAQTTERCNLDKDLHKRGRLDLESHQPEVAENLAEVKGDDFILGMVNYSRLPDDQDVQVPTSGEIEDIITEDGAREEAGCVLWDLAASQSHADFLVENHILEVLVAILYIPQSNRMREICLGIFGNLACHAQTEKAMVKTQGLMPMVVQQLFVADAPSLIETCRVLTAGLHSDEATQWEEAIHSDEILEHIMWIAANTMNSQLLEKSTELLLAMVDSKKGKESTLATPLLHLGLLGFLTDVIACEMAAIIEGASTRGDVVLENVLRIGEALSLSDDSAIELARNEQFFALACQIIQLSEKDEFGPSAVTAMVLVANLLTENTQFMSKVLHYAVVEHLVALLPSVGDDPGARNAFWSILERISEFIVSSKTEKPVGYSRLMRVLAAGSYTLVTDLDEHREADVGHDENQEIVDHIHDAGISRGLQAKFATLCNLVSAMKEWAASQSKCLSQLQHSVESACRLLQNQIMVNQGPSGFLPSETYENGSS